FLLSLGDRRQRVVPRYREHVPRLDLQRGFDAGPGTCAGTCRRLEPTHPRRIKAAAPPRIVPARETDADRHARTTRERISERMIVIQELTYRVGGRLGPALLDNAT